jgi:hypothetical protein
MQANCDISRSQIGVLAAGPFFTAKCPLRAGQPQQAQLDPLFLFRIGLGERLAVALHQRHLS